MIDARTLRRTASALCLTASLALTGGCEFIDAFSGEGNTLVNVFSTHHATPENGVVPDRGGEGEVRVFETDEGWTVHLVYGVVTTRGVTLHHCDGGEAPVDLYFGSHAEDLSGTDLDRQTVGGTEVSASKLCGMTVHYGPFSMQNDRPPAKADDLGQLDGNTVFLAGFAERGDARVPFEIQADGPLDVYVDFADTMGEPLRVTGDEPFPVELTVSKTYDRFFDGVDFESLDSDELAEQARAVLELETQVDATR